MPIKLGEQKSGLSSYGIIYRQTVKDMVEYYRQRIPAGKEHAVLQHVHYSVLELLNFLKDNDIIKDGTLLDKIFSQNPDIKAGNLGVKIYIATHKSANDCPTVGGVRRMDYRDRDTVIMCSTKKEPYTYKDGNTKDSWVDQLADNIDSIIFSGHDALEQGSICPPDCSEDNQKPPIPIVDILY